MENYPPPTVHQSRVLKLEPNCCTECAMKVKRAMLKVDGVHSIKVNSKEGTIQVESEIDPQILIAMAAKAGKRAELLWESQPDNISTTTPSTDIATHLSNFDHTAHLQDLLDKYATGIKHMEIVDKRVTKITFKESLDHPHTNACGGQTTASGGCGNVEATPPPPAAASSSPPPPPSEINYAPCNINQVVEPPVANVSCNNERTTCRVM